MIRRTWLIIKVLICQKPLITLIQSDSALVLKCSFGLRKAWGRRQNGERQGWGHSVPNQLKDPAQGTAFGHCGLRWGLHFLPFSQEASAEHNYTACQALPFTGSFMRISQSSVRKLSPEDVSPTHGQSPITGSYPKEILTGVAGPCVPEDESFPLRSSPPRKFYHLPLLTDLPHMPPTSWY